MGNKSRGKDGDGTSGVNKVDDENYEEQEMQFLQTDVNNTNGFIDPMVHSPPPLVIHQRHALMQNGFVEYVVHERLKSVRITWNHPATSVAIAGSWDNWETTEPLHNAACGQSSFVILKTLPICIYHYRFIVDGYWTHAPEFPSAYNVSGHAYNILDLQDILSRVKRVISISQELKRLMTIISKIQMIIYSYYCLCAIPYIVITLLTTYISREIEAISNTKEDYVPETLGRLSYFEDPPSPPSSYDNIFLDECEFSKPPPELPPQLPVTIREEPSTSNSPFSPRPTHLELNHLYIHKTDSNQCVALRSTNRFQQKYVTMVLYKSLHREL